MIWYESLTEFFQALGGHFGSSAAAHCGLRDDPILSSQATLTKEIGDWGSWLREEDQSKTDLIRQQTRSGRPCESVAFVQRLEDMMKRALRPARRRPKPKTKGEKKVSFVVCPRNPEIGRGRPKKEK